MGGPSYPDVELPVTILPLQRIGAIVTVLVQGVEYRARITDIAHGKAALRLFEPLSRPSESGISISLIQALPSKERMELIIQKTTELGVTAILPCVTAKSTALSDRAKKQDKSHRWAAVAAKAAKQSRRRVIPRIGECTDLVPALKNAADSDLKLILYEKEIEFDLHSFADKMIKNLAIAAGPEGGFTEEDISLARTYGFLPVRLGGRILRCETASIAAVSIAQFVWGDL